jgi:hypothetical protein
MKLAGDKPGMIFQFDDLNQPFAGIRPDEKHPLLPERRFILIIKLVPVPVPLGDIFFFIRLITQ